MDQSSSNLGVRIMPTVTLKVPVRRPKEWSYDFGTVQLNDPVSIVPEPENPFDCHALRIDDGRGQVMGYIPAELAAKITPKLSGKIWKLGTSHVTEIDRQADWTSVFVLIQLHVPD